MKFKYYHILWVFLGISALIFLFMPTTDEFEQSENKKEQITQIEKNGYISSFSKKGVLKTKVKYTNGIKNGSSFLYYSDGKTVQLEMPYVQGKREGLSKKYYENGNIYAITPYKNDRLNGIRKLHYTSGEVKAEIPYQNNNVGIGLKEYLKDGRLKNKNSIEVERNGNVLNLRTALQCKKAKFYIGKLIDDNFFDPVDEAIRLLPNSGSQFYVDISTFSPSYLKYQDVICSCKTNQGNPLILKRRIDVSSLKNVNQ